MPLSDYTIIQGLGDGAFARVVKVKHKTFGYVRAIKILNTTILDGESDPIWIKFCVECGKLLRIGNGSHHNIVRIDKPQLDEMRAYVEMEFIDGKDINHIIEEHRIVPVIEVVNMARDISSALAYCHHHIFSFSMNRDEDDLPESSENGVDVALTPEIINKLVKKYRVIHNDIHGGNIMRRADGSYVLLDFGLAIDGKNVVRQSQRNNGAPEYKSPEKWENESTLTESSDIYSFGIVLYELLTGNVPFPFNKSNSNISEAEHEVMIAHKKSPVPSIFEARKRFFEAENPGKTYTRDYPQWLEDMILKCLEKNPADRFKNGKELHDFISNHIKIVFDDGTITPTSTSDEEIKKLQATITRLRNEISALKTEIEKLSQSPTSTGSAEAEVDRLRARVKELCKQNITLRDAKEKAETELKEALAKLEKQGGNSEGKNKKWWK